MNTSNHAESRMEQRGISQFMIDLVLEFGSCEYHKGCEVYLMTKFGCEKADSYFGHKISKFLISKLNGIYVVVKNNTIITASRKTKHFKMNRKH